MPRVTVLMPVHNGALYLRQAVESILAQTFRDIELLVVDDVSEDDSMAIVAAIADRRIRLIRSDRRLRLAGALNLGLREAKGNFVARMDADDLALPRRIEAQVAVMASRPRLGICGTPIRRFGGGKPEIERYPRGVDKVRAHCLFNVPFAHPTVMLRRDLFLKHDLAYDVSYYPTEDYELWERALKLFAGDNLARPLLKYRVHEDSLTGSGWREMDRQAARVSARQLADLGFEPDEETARFHRNVATGAVEQSLPEIRRAEKWLRSILAANDARLVFDNEALAEVIGGLWLKLCMRSTALGWRRVAMFAGSPLAGRKRAAGAFLCAASALKAALGRH